MNKFIINNKAQEADQQTQNSKVRQQKAMLSDFAQTKIYKSKTQPTESFQNIAHQSQPYVNPIIKHTLESLPIIYGGNMNRKRKYNVFMKSKLQLNNIISRVHDKNYLPNQRLYKRMNSLHQDRQKGYSAFELNDSKDIGSDEREEITKTVAKKKKRLITEPDIAPGSYERQTGHSRAISNQEKVHQELVIPKKKNLIRLQSLDELAKPKDKCKNQYCSCKSIYQEYQNQINKKMNQKLKVLTASRKQNSHKLNLPRLSFQISQKVTSKLDDQQSKHKVSFRSKINSMGDTSQNSDNCCHSCKKDQKQPENTQKGILGLIKKKQLQEKRNKLAYYSQTQDIGIALNNMGTQMNENQTSQSEAQNEQYGTQADLINHPKKLKTIDQQINTDFQQQSQSFRYLENNKNLKDSALKQNKKQPMQHLSHLKEKYKYQKRPGYKSKYDKDNEDNQNGHQNDQDSEESPDRCSNPGHKKDKEKHGNKNKKQLKIDPLNTSNDSIISQNSMMNHLANALATNGKDKSTIFKLLKKKQEESEREGSEAGQKGRDKNKKASNLKKQHKKLNLIDEGTGLFSIPEEQQYVDYLKGYQPIQKDFKIKELVKSQNFKILKYKDTLYFGEAKADNTKNGKALVISPKQIFEGIYENGVKMSGCERNIDGVYIGDFLNGMRHGDGKWIWNNEQIYEGEWKLGTKNGYGIWKSPKGDQYEGQWVLNRQQGKGIHRHKNSVYEGEFVQALKQGQGRQKYINGDEYIGEYYKGKPHGKGKYIWKNGNAYEGQFKDGLRSGHGKWSYSNKAYYEGEFSNDFKHGKGKEIFLNGDQFEGQYYEGQKSNGVYIEFATGKVRDIKIEKKGNQKNEEKAKEKQASLTKSRMNPKEKQELKQKSIKKSQSKEQHSVKSKNSVISRQPQQGFKIKPISTQNDEILKKSKVSMEVQKNEQKH